MTQEERQQPGRPRAFGPSVWIRLAVGLGLWSAQICIGAWALYMKLTGDMGVVIPFFFGIPVGFALCLAGGVLVPRPFRERFIVVFALPMAASFGCMVLGMLGLQDT